MGLGAHLAGIFTQRHAPRQLDSRISFALQPFSHLFGGSEPGTDCARPLRSLLGSRRNPLRDGNGFDRPFARLSTHHGVECERGHVRALALPLRLIDVYGTQAPDCDRNRRCHRRNRSMFCRGCAAGTARNQRTHFLRSPLSPRLVIAIVSGILSCLPNIGITFGVNTVKAALDRGISPAADKNAVWFIFFTCGGIVNVIYCAWLMVSRGNLAVFFARGQRSNWLRAAGCGYGRYVDRELLLVRVRRGSSGHRRGNDRMADSDCPIDWNWCSGRIGARRMERHGACGKISPLARTGTADLGAPDHSMGYEFLRSI